MVLGYNLINKNMFTTLLRHKLTPTILYLFSNIRWDNREAVLKMTTNKRLRKEKSIMVLRAQTQATGIEENDNNDVSLHRAK